MTFVLRLHPSSEHWLVVRLLDLSAPHLVSRSLQLNEKQ